MAKMNGGRPVPDAGLVLSSNILCGTATLGGTWSNCAVFAVGTDGLVFGLLIGISCLVLSIMDYVHKRKPTKAVLQGDYSGTKLIFPFCIPPLLFSLMLIVGYFQGTKEDRGRAFALTFRDVVSAARSYKTENLHGQLVYPFHSIVVYSLGSGSGGRSVFDYHFACPFEWRATTKEEARLVVLVEDSHSSTLIGHYWDSGGRAAYSSRWNVLFIDLALRQIVAVAGITITDPEYLSRGSNNPSDDDPNDEKVVSAIRKTVKFSNNQWER